MKIAMGYFKRLIVSKLGEFLALFIFTVFSMLIRGYEYGTGNQIHYLTYLNYYLQPALYPFDYLLKTHRIPYTIFIDLLKNTPFIRTNPETVIFIIYTLFLYAFYIGLFYLVFKLFNDKKLSWLALLLFVITIPIGGSTIFTVEKSFIPRFAADVFLILSVYFLLAKKFTRSAVIAAVGFLFHPLTLITYPLILGILWFYKYAPFKKLIQGFTIFTLISLPMLTKFLVQDSKVGIFIDSAWKEVLTERMPYVFILKWASYDYLLLGAIVAFFIFFSRFSQKKAKINPVVSASIIAGLILLLVSILSDITSFRLGLQLQLPRNLYLMVIFAIIYFVRFLTLRFTGNAQRIVMSIVIIGTFAVTVIARGPDGILISRPYNDFEKVAIWAKSNTPITAIFVIPPDKDGFRFLSERSVVNESKEGGDGLYDRSFSLEWDRREDILEQNNFVLNTKEIMVVKKAFRMDYIVTTQTLPYPVVHRSGVWKIYKI